ncbi:PAS domain-containing protein [Pedobacter heparinus]|uniref:PAS domain-containing protein n=1 Tax=Pedobacter heparinus TaxID=984 RepID=UPI00292F1972|nr:PAS domain-containing protein [Pedobacter heparinus]
MDNHFSRDQTVPNFKELAERSHLMAQFKIEEEKYNNLLTRFNTLSKATSDAVWDLDIKSGHMIWNKGITGIFGHRDIDPTREWWQSHIHPEDLHLVLHEFELLFKNHKNRSQTEYRFRCVNGTYKSVLDRSFILFDEQENPIRIIGSIQDITERVNYVNAMQEQNVRLREISWIQSHQVRAPLARIMGLVKLLDATVADPDVKEIANHLNASAEELDHVISNILKKTS